MMSLPIEWYRKKITIVDELTGSKGQKKTGGGGGTAESPTYRRQHQWCDYDQTQQ